MKRMKERIKRKLAMFLAVCLVLTSFQGVAWADSESESRDVTIALSGEKIREAAENAIRSGFLYENQYSFENADSDEAGEPESYKNLFDGSTGSVFVLDEIPYANEASASEAIPDDAELQMFVKISEEAKAERASKSEADRASSSETAIDTANYELRGDETIIFLFINRSNDELNFQLDIDGRKSGIVTVESGSSLLSEEETVPAEETAAEELETEEAGPGGEVPDAEAPADGSNGGVSGGSSSDGSSLTEDETNPADESQAADTETDENGSADENGSEAEDKPENNTPDAGDIHTGNENVTDSKDQTESNENTNTSGSESAGKPEDKETTQPEASDNNSSSNEDQKNGGNENQSSNAETGDTGSESSDSSESGSHSDSGSSEEKSSSGSEGNSGSDSNSGSGSDSSSDGGSSSDSSSDVQVSMSSYSVPRVMSINGPSGIDGGDEEDEDMDFEDWQDMQLDDEDDEESCDDDVIVYSDSYAGVDLAAEVLPTVLVKRNRGGLFRALVREKTASAAVMTASLNNLTRAAGTTNFDVTLYDYSGTAKEADAINTYLQGKNAKILFNATKGSQYPAGNYYWWSESQTTYNIVQGLVPKTYNGDSFDGNFFKEADLFPKEQGSISNSNVKVYSDVNLASDFFTEDEDGYYLFDSNQASARFDSKNGNVLSSSGGVEGKFWPFGNGDWYFGMKMNFDFYMPEEGKVNGKDLTFEFSGDDDVWVYLKPTDSQDAASCLILDIGGNHGQMDGKVNFATGEIEYSYPNASDVQKNTYVVTHIYDKNGDAAEVKNQPTDGKYYASLYTKDAAIAKVMKENGYTAEKAESYVEEKYIDFMGFEEAYDNKTYQLGFYYLERGGNDSNCKMKFNLPIIPKAGVKIQKQVQGELPSANAKFDFNIISADNREKLQAYKDGTGSEDDVVITPCSILGIGSVQADLETGRYFYVEESAASAGKSVNWDVSGGTIAAVTGNTTDIYQITEESGGYLLQCTNVYGELSPTIAKRAWKDYSITDDGVYDITLEVTGDEVKTTSGSTSGDPVDMVFVMDRSNSISNNDFTSMKAAIQNMSKKLVKGSKVSVIAFAGEEEYARADNSYQVSYDNPESSKYYKNVTEGWIDSEDSAALEDKLSALNTTYYTHSAAGFLGARHMLQEVKDDTNKKVVIYMTDGEPNSYIEGKNWYGEIYYTWCDTSYNGGSVKEATKKAQNICGKVVSENPGVSIYTIGYGNNVGNATWLTPEGTSGITKYYSAKDVSELEKIFTEINNIVTTSLKIIDPVVTDQLTDNVVLGEITVGGTKVQAPTLYVKDGTVNGTQENGTQTVADKGTELVPALSDGIVRYTYPNDTSVIAEYNTATKTITWYVGRSSGGEDTNVLGKTTKTLIYRVTAADQINDPTERGQEDTGTHTGELGYRSNVEAYLTFAGHGEQENEYTFKHPVVNPVTSKLTVRKDVMGVADNESLNGTYSFSVKFGSGTKYGEQEDAVWDEDKKQYTFQLADRGNIDFTGIPKNETYTITETGDNIENSDYVLTGIAVSGEGTTAIQSQEAHPKTLSSTGVIVKGGSTAAFTNTYSKYGYITVEKELGGDESAYPEEGDRTFTFNVTPEKGTQGAYSSVNVTAGTPVQIKVEPEDKNIAFTITETDRKGAWKTTVNGNNDTNSGTAKAGETITFTNEYYQHNISLTKNISGTNQAADAAYEFVVKVKTTGGSELSSEDINLRRGDTSAAAVKNFEAVTNDRDGYTYQFKVSGVKADETVTIMNLPKQVTEYMIVENLAAAANIGSNYNIVLDNAALNGSAVTEPDKGVVNTLKSLGSQNDTVIFTNKFNRAVSKLKITKNLVKSADAAAAAAAEEPLTFTFEVVDTSGKSFYATITVPEGESTASTELTIPVGSYCVKELPSLRYAVVENEKNVSVTGETTEEVQFSNYKNSSSYFSDTSIKVNTVTATGFKETAPEPPISRMSPKAILSSIYGNKEDRDEE